MIDAHGLPEHPPPDTLAVFVTEEAVADTSTVTEIASKLAPAANTFEFVHVTVSVVVLIEQPQPVLGPAPEAAVAVNPDGNTSVTVTVPDVAAAPAAFETVIEYESPVSPCLKLPECDFATDNTGTAFNVNVAVTDRAWLIVTTQVPDPEHAPDQPVNDEPAAGAAVNVTTVPDA